MTLIEKQKLFSISYARLILHAVALGYEVTLGETTRSQVVANYYERRGIGIANSLHLIKLAGDLNLFRNGKYLTLTSDYEELGQWWESQSTPHAKFIWGGRFDDGDHFSIEHNGVK